MAFPLCRVLLLLLLLLPLGWLAFDLLHTLDVFKPLPPSSSSGSLTSDPTIVCKTYARDQAIGTYV